MLRLVSRFLEKLFQRHQPITQPEPNSRAQTRAIRSAQEPRSHLPGRMRPKRFHAFIQCDAVDLYRQFGAFNTGYSAHRGEQRNQIACIDPLLPDSTVLSHLRFRHAVVHRFNGIATREGRLGARPVRLNDHVRVRQHDRERSDAIVHNSTSCSTPRAASISGKSSIET